jgi:hypothetical protein
MYTVKRMLFCASIMLSLSACGPINWGVGLPIVNGNYIPDVDLKGDQRRQYEEDVAICQRNILMQYGEKFTTNNAITDLRRCLIDKGYVLLS